MINILSKHYWVCVVIQKIIIFIQIITESRIYIVLIEYIIHR